MRFKWLKLAIVLVVLAAILIGWRRFFDQKNGENNSTVVMVKELVQEVSISGRVVPVTSADLSLKTSGRVARVPVRVGDRVGTDQELISLEVSTLASELKVAQADLALKRSESKNTEVNLEAIRQEQDIIVDNAYYQLLSEGLSAVPMSSNYNVTPPVITGRYRGREGVYKFNIKREQTGIEDYELRTFGLEKTKPIEILEDEPTALGTGGLFVSFSDDLSNYHDTSWEITIPNTKSALYPDNFNAYQEVLRTRTKEIAKAEAELATRSDGVAVATAEIEKAEAEIARIQTQINEQMIRAPFAGVVTEVAAEVGETVSANSPIVSLISGDDLEIESFVPEINISLIKIGDPATVTLDAYGEEVKFPAKVIFIDPAETIRDGVSTYKTTLRFTTLDERIKPGMTVNGRVITARVPDLILVPEGLVFSKEGNKYVRVKTGDQAEDRLIVTGRRSSFGEMEILSGLSSGEEILPPLAAD